MRIQNILLVVTLSLSMVCYINIGEVRSTSKLEGQNVTESVDLAYSTYLGGIGDENYAAIAIDSSGNIILAGTTASYNFPTLNAFDSTFNGDHDVFISKFTADGRTLLYSTFLGSNGWDACFTLILDANDNIIISGTTTSDNFPLKNAYLSNKSTSERDVFVTKLSADGQTLLFSTYFGSGSEYILTDVCLDDLNNIIIAGSTDSSVIPTTNGYQTENNGAIDGFIGKLSADGQNLLFFTYLGGQGNEEIRRIDVDTNDNIFFCGYTSSVDFPVKNALQSNKSQSSWNIFLGCLNSDGQSLLFSTYFGGCRQYALIDLVLDKSGNIVIIGETDSNNYSIANAYQTDYGGGSSDAFIAKLSPDGLQIIFSTYLGGNAADSAIGVAIDTYNNIILTGSSISSNFPIINEYQTKNNNWDAFISAFSPNGQILFFSTSLGGSRSDYGYELILDADANIIFLGHGDSTDFPTVNPYQSSKGGGWSDFYLCILTINLPNLSQTSTQTLTSTQTSTQTNSCTSEITTEEGDTPGFSFLVSFMLIIFLIFKKTKKREIREILVN